MTPETETFIRRLLVDPGRELRTGDQVPHITYTIIHAQRHDIRNHTVPLHDIHRGGYLEGMLTMNRTRNFHAYAGIGYRSTALPPGRRGGKDAILALPALYVDIDNPDFQAVSNRLADVLCPSLLVASGGGFHAYWRLAPPTRQLRRAGRILNGLAAYLGSDSSMTVDQIMRVPGTLNCKPERERAPCKIVESHFSRTYTLDDFRAFEPALQIASNPAPRKPARQSADAHRAAPSDRYIPQALIEAISQRFRAQGAVMKRDGWMGVYCPYGHRHDRFPGDHACWKPEKGVLHCFGDKHRDNTGTFETAQLLNIDTTRYEAFHRHEQTHTYTI